MILIRSFAATLIAVLSLVAPAITLANGGQVRVDAETAGPYEVSVFSSPTPLRAGIVDINAQVIDRETGDPADAVVVTLLARHPETATEIERTLTSEAATEAGYRATEFELPQTGEWDFEVLIQDADDAWSVSFSAEVEEARGFGWSQLVVGLLIAPLIVFVILIAMRGWTRPGEEPDSNAE